MDCKDANKALVSEAHHTTHIEGTQLSIEQAELLMAGNALSHVDQEDVKELLNYREAFELVSESINDGRPVTEALVREIHKLLVQGVRGDAAAPGEYRKVQNYVVKAKTKEVIDTPPEAIEVPRLMAELIHWLKVEGEINPVLKAGIAQFQLVHIHPFLDGNGRTARLLSTLYLYQSGYDFKKLFSISEYYDRDRESYYRAIQSARNNDRDLTQWVEYFVVGLATQLQEIKVNGEAVVKRGAILANLTKEHKLNDRQLSLLEAIYDSERMTLSELENVLKINRRTLQRDLKKFLEVGVIKEISSSPTDPLKYYVPNLPTVSA
jgi:cell filamentation protein, protein adenylyltransferase